MPVHNVMSPTGAPGGPPRPDWAGLARARAPWVLSAAGPAAAGGVAAAAGPLRRAAGLLGRRGLPAGRWLALFPCGAVHTWFMRFDLDVVFLDRGGRVLRRVPRLRPWRAAAGGRGAFCALEAAAGWLPADALRPGERVGLVPAPAGKAPPGAGPREGGQAGQGRGAVLDSGS